VGKLVGNVFKPELKDLKRRLENLLDRGYLKRDIQDMNLYHYNEF
jgi:hypothetical protein